MEKKQNEKQNDKNRLGPALRFSTSIEQISRALIPPIPPQQARPFADPAPAWVWATFRPDRSQDRPLRAQDRQLRP